VLASRLWATYGKVSFSASGVGVVFETTDRIREANGAAELTGVVVLLMESGRVVRLAAMCPELSDGGGEPSISSRGI
jgi:hypothetical protein